MPINVPLQIDFNGGGGGSNIDSSDDNQKNVRIFNALKEKLKATSTERDVFSSNETTTNFTLSETNLENSLSANFFDSQVKLDIYKTVYDYFFYTILNKYYVFYFVFYLRPRSFTFLNFEIRFFKTIYRKHSSKIRLL
jgi:hypothetical protein